MQKFLTLSELVQKVIRNLSLYQGTSTQKYAEDRISETILLIFNRLYDERYWSFLTNWYKYNLTGVNGVCEEDVSKDITNFYDIESISTQDNPKYALKRLHHSTNPYLVTGSTPAYYINTNIDKKIFAVVPFDAKGVIYVRAKSKPQEFFPNTIVPFDPDVLIYGACYEYCADDGNSQTQLQKFKELYAQRLQQLTSMENSGTFDWNDEQVYTTINEWR